MVVAGAHNHRLPDPVRMTQELVRFPSVTPQDHGCMAHIAGWLEPLGFTIHRLRFGVTENLYARLGTHGPLFCFAGHTDVVPAGTPELWHVPPFAGEIRDGYLIGRGVCDMKGGVAAMVAALQRFLPAHPEATDHFSLALLITGDEEGEGSDGTLRVLDWLQERGEQIDYCLVGEPTSIDRLGDCLKNGRRGSMDGHLVVQGKSGHVAYPQLANNVIHAAGPWVAQLAGMTLDAGNADFAPSSLQLTTLHSASPAGNVIPDQLEARFNIRFNTEQTPERLTATLRELCDRMAAAAHVTYQLETRANSLPFLTQPGWLLGAMTEAIQAVTGLTPERSTGGGTSDARLIAPVCPEVVEFGVPNGTIHQINESCRVEDLVLLSEVYLALLERLLKARH
jgi:succinyl-diaminopimelate desuccinylase